MSDAPKFDVFAEDIGFPEGPVVMADGSVITVDVIGGRIFRCWGNKRKEVIATPGGGPNGLAVGADGALYLCNNGGVDTQTGAMRDGPGNEGRIERIDLATGRVERIYDRFEGNFLSAPNDIAIDAAGDIWFSDLGKFTRDIHHASTLYHAKGDGSGLRAVHRGFGAYNGVGLSPDGKTAYAAEMLTARLYAFDTDPAAVNGNRRLVGAASGDVMFDSLGVTAAGNVCIAQLHVGGIVTITPTGEVSVLPMPDPHTTNIAFGGDDMRTAYVTQSGRSAIVSMRWPEAGLRLNFNA